MVPPYRCLLTHFEVTLHSILVVANLLAHNKLITYGDVIMCNNLATAMIECSFEMGKQTPLGIPFILLYISFNIIYINIIYSMILCCEFDNFFGKMTTKKKYKI